MTRPAFIIGEAVRLVSSGVDLGKFPVAGIKGTDRGWYYQLAGEKSDKFWPEQSLEPVHQGDRFTVYGAAEALKPQPPIAWVVDKLFSEGSVSLLVGDGGCGKTYAMLDAAVCIADGREWLGYATTQRRALIVDEESGKRRLSRRLGDVMRGHKVGAGLPLSYISLERVDLRTSTDIEALEELVEKTGAGFIVVDALVDVMMGGKENAAEDVHPVFMALRGVAERQRCAFVVIHHNNKLGGYRGSTSMKAAVDLLLAMEKDGDELEFDVEKARDVALFKFGARAYFGDDEFYLAGGSVHQAAPSFSESERYVLFYLRDNGKSKAKEIEDHADVCEGSTARRRLYDLVADGLVERVDEGGRGAVGLYDLTKDGNLALAML